MPRTGKGAVIHLDVLGQGIEKRRQQTRFDNHRPPPPAPATPDLYRRSPPAPPPALSTAVSLQQVDRQVQSATPEESKDAAATVGHGDDETAATSVKSVLSSATTRRWVDKRVTSSQLAAMCMDFISANARIGSVKTSDKGRPCPTMCPGLTVRSDRRTSVKADGVRSYCCPTVSIRVLRTAYGEQRGKRSKMRQPAHLGRGVAGEIMAVSSSAASYQGGENSAQSWHLSRTGAR